MFTVKRSPHNPILPPLREHPWEAAASFNGSPAMYKKKHYLVYRALGEPDPLIASNFRMSVVGVASSKDDINYSDRSVLIAPDTEYDRYGCEDPRVTKFDNTYYIFYTAISGFPFSQDNVKSAVALSKDLKTITEKHLVTPFNAKAMVLFPEKVNGKIAALLTVDPDKKPAEICYAEFATPEQMWSEEYWQDFYAHKNEHAYALRRADHEHVEIGSAPLKTDKGWLVLYSHIQHYDEGNTVFGIEAMLLDLKNPRMIIGRTKGTMMIPEDYYEKIGMVRNIVFPSGASIEDDTLAIYYGTSDTHTAKATTSLSALLASMLDVPLFTRASQNPILAPRPGLAWEQGGVLNPAAIELKGTIYLIYRSVSDKNVSTFGFATTKDGVTIDERPDQPIYIPHASFETRGGEDSNFGAEDPRIVEFGDRLYITYTGYNGIVPRVSIVSIKTEDFLKRNWSAWSEPAAISPDYIGDKDAALLPELVKKQYMIFHRIGVNVCVDFENTLDFKNPITKCIELFEPRHGMWDSEKVGIAGTPIKTKKGWLVLYHGISSKKTYRVGALLLDLKDPTTILARTAEPIFEPRAEYEMSGVVSHVVFPCGTVVRKDTVFMYYGGGDSVVGVATASLNAILATLA